MLSLSFSKYIIGSSDDLEFLKILSWKSISKVLEISQLFLFYCLMIKQYYYKNETLNVCVLDRN